MVCGGGGEVRVKEGVEVELRKGVGEGSKEGGREAREAVVAPILLILLGDGCLARAGFLAPSPPLTSATAVHPI